MFQLDYPSPVGNLLLASDGTALTELRRTSSAGRQDSCPVLQQAAAELDEYFAGQRQAFTVPLHPTGTPFQQAAWAALLRIPYGQTRSYAQQAAVMGCPNAARAVGQANHRNPICILIPCHRVLGANGSLTGYGCGLDMKRFLLMMEGALPEK